MLINGVRALAHVQEIAWVKPIEGADNIETVGVLGWTCIAKKGEFKQGELCVYFEIDSKLPEAEWSAFMAAKHYKVKTLKFGKFNVVSQGLALPAVILEDEGLRRVGADVTDYLGVEYASREDAERKAEVKENKYAPMIRRHKKLFKKKIIQKMMKYTWFRECMFFILGKNKNNNPKAFPTHFEFISKTDEERIENLPNLLGDTDEWGVCEKLDGTSATYILERKPRGKFEYYVCSRNVRQLDEKQSNYHSLDIKDNVYWQMSNLYGIKEFLQNILNENPELNYVCLQGEIIGKKIQGNIYNLDDIQLYIFNYIDSMGRYNTLESKCILDFYKGNGVRHLEWVPFLSIEEGLPKTMEEMKAAAEGKSVTGECAVREGLVYRRLVPKAGCVNSFKNVSKSYLLNKKGE